MTSPLRLLALSLALLTLAVQAAQAACQPFTHEGRAYTLCEAEISQGELRLWLRGDDGEVLGSFARLEAHVAYRSGRIVFAMNAGMYHADRRPVGLYVEDGVQVARLVTSVGPGNFGLLPNGVFCIGDTRFAIIESRRFAEGRQTCRHATQSGPILVIDGALHPRFLPDSTSRFVRNGVGVSADGQRAYFLISRSPVTFHEFARAFRDGLGLRDALYFDGNVSRLLAPAMGRSDRGRTLGPMVGLLAPPG